MDDKKIEENSHPTYNNCFCLGGKVPIEAGKFKKVAIYLENGKIPMKLYDGKGGKLGHYYEMSYEEAKSQLEAYKALKGNTISEGAKTMRVCLYLDNARFGDLHIFVMDFDAWDEKSDFFQAAKALQIRQYMILHICQIFHILLILFIAFSLLVADPAFICQFHFILHL